jgi:uncharacterized protein (DUF433 family)
MRLLNVRVRRHDDSCKYYRTVLFPPPVRFRLRPRGSKRIDLNHRRQRTILRASSCVQLATREQSSNRSRGKSFYNGSPGMDYRQIITIEPDKMGGKPCIRGLRITVYDVLDYLASGMTDAEILADFPDLTAEDLRAALAFAADRERKLLSIPA